ncbi:acyl dehydratase [Frankia sp. EI5c]|uniref:MaoC/PaaZ C-terminal domain-containing protein n=1 Tax=Frankia sp. EI5c TaxID=683316 RepID=UPI0007C40C2A|nr:MaoC/PaaZ C-terminal domain-containing protein [Frankia sp. EI5c]OAA27461.1 acyl dehydratase [Frankia sp. EI5c]
MTPDATTPDAAPVTAAPVTAAAVTAAAAGAAGAPASVDSRELARHVGAAFLAEPPLLVTPELVGRFATMTGADHWMHVDQERARASPLGRATVQGLLTLALGAELEKRALAVRASDAVFHGFDRVRFPAPMFVGDPLGLRVEILAAEELDGAVRVRLRHTFSSLGPRPVCVSEQAVRYVHRPAGADR